MSLIKTNITAATYEEAPTLPWKDETLLAWANSTSSKYECLLQAVTAEDLAKRKDELAKMRSLLFRHEEKSRHMAKIKSKDYHRRMKKSARLKATAPPYMLYHCLAFGKSFLFESILSNASAEMKQTA